MTSDPDKIIEHRPDGISTSTSNKFLEERKFSFKEAIKVANAQPEGYPTGLYIHYATMKYTYYYGQL
jgi:hypothetical protein